MDHPTDLELNLLADAELKNDQVDLIIKHIKSCPECKIKLNELLDFDDFLKRADETLLKLCPSEDQLFEFLEGRAGKDVCKHVEDCVVCRGKVDSAKHILGKHNALQDLPKA